MTTSGYWRTNYRKRIKTLEKAAVLDNEGAPSSLPAGKTELLEYAKKFLDLTSYLERLPPCPKMLAAIALTPHVS
jgi:hypothetical protein